MSNPLLSLKKQKKTPLYLPEMPGASSSPAMSSSTSNQNYPQSNLLTPIDKLIDVDNETSRSPISSFANNFSVRSSLNKKLNELPLSSRVPFKTKIDDSDLIDEYTTKIAISNLKRNLPPAKSNQTPTDMDLMQIMMSKIKSYEARCAFIEKESKEKEKKIMILEEKLKIINKANNETKNQNDQIKELERKNLKLKNKIYEMESFLADYGLKWVGENNEDKSDDADDYFENDEDPNDIVGNDLIINDINNSNNTDANKIHQYISTLQTASTNLLDCKFKCDYDKIVSNVKELNLLCEHNEPKIVNFNNGAKFESSNETVDLTLYSNGILLFNGPFRSFDDSLTQKFCIDIMDGYFPSELQTRYPDGVTFQLNDKRDIFYKQENPNSVFKSKGYRLGSSTINSARYTIATISKNESLNTESNSDKTLTVEEFLKKLPETIIKNGKLIDIKNDLKQLIDGHNDSSTSKSQPRSVSIIDNTLNKEKSKLNENVTVLKIKSLTNENINFILKMNYTDTIQNLKDTIKSQRKLTGLDECNEFDLACMYPRKLLTDLNLSLEQCELVPNSNILIMPHTK